jgi:lipoprotein NlpI
MARARAGEDGRAELAVQAKRLDLLKWPGPVVALYLGNGTPEEVLLSARNPDPQKQREQQCEAYYYLGQHALIRGDRTEAIRLFRAAVESQVTDFVEYYAARVELKRLAP